MKIPICKPYLDESEEIEVIQVLRSGWLMQGPRVEQFESLVKGYTGAEFAVAVSSCSTALHLAMRALEIGPGDEVVVPSLTWVATAAAVEECGARPTFCDVDRKTFNVDIEQLESLITPRTKAIIPVNLFGLPADLPRICSLAGKHGIDVIEDAACSLGSAVENQQTGTFGRLGCFSFHPRKSITTGEGGVIVGRFKDDESNLRSLRSHGSKMTNGDEKKKSSPFDLGDFDKLGYNYRMSDLHAAVGLAQFRKLDAIIARRRKIAKLYNEQLKGLELISLPTEPKGYYHSYQSYVLMIADESNNYLSSSAMHSARNKLMNELQSKDVATRPGTHAVHTLSYYANKYELHDSDFPNSALAMNQSIALPLYPSMTNAEIDYVVRSFKMAHAKILSRQLVAV